MIREVETPEQIDAKELVNTIQQGYLVGRDPEHKQKKTFGPSTIAYGYGECPRYWYLAFEGAIFEDDSDAYAIENMTNGTLSHGRIEAAFKNSGISININAFSQFFKTIINALFYQRKSFRQLCDWF